MSNSSQYHLPWVEKYRPEKRINLVGNEAAINGLYLYLKNWTYKKSNPAALLIGPPGCGKTSTVYAIANEMNYSITEVNASDARSKNKIKEVLSYTSEFVRLDDENKKQLILMDEIDGLSGSKDRGGLNEFLKILKISRFPIVSTANDPESDKITSLIRKGKVRVFEFFRLEEYEIFDLLEKIIKAEEINISESVIEQIAENSAGDTRAAINELESFHVGTDITSLQKRNKYSILKDIINNLFSAKSINEAKAAWRNAPSDYNLILLHLFDQTHNQCRNTQEIEESYDQIARADLILSRIRSNQNWSLLKYFFNHIGQGLFLSRPSKEYNKLRKLDKLPSSYILRGIAKRKFSKANTIAPTIAPILHISKNYFIYKEFEIVSKIILGKDGAEIAAWLNLSDDEITLFQSLNPKSDLIDKIGDARRKIGRDRLMNQPKNHERISSYDMKQFLSTNEDERNEKNVQEIIEEDLIENNIKDQSSLDDFF